jgi:hypothetical protein
MNRIRNSLAAVAIALLAAGIGLAVAPAHPARPPAAHLSAHLTADGSGSVTYASQGVTFALPSVTTAVPAPAAATAQSVMDSFRSQQVPAGVVGKEMDSAPHTVSQAQVTEVMPTSPEVIANTPYGAWVVTYTGLPAVSYAPAPPPAGVSCTFVGVMNRATGDWTEFFSSCS